MQLQFEESSQEYVGTEAWISSLQGTGTDSCIHRCL